MPIEEGAKFVRYFKSRVKTEKAFGDLEGLEKSILGPAKCVQKQRKRARQALLFG
ncbi:MAG: hypothetical protein LYZ70_03745 [Nitrososphaerales archaeon]|nr:hypothetical protein [Nitrososphaerales archaeon]